MNEKQQPVIKIAGTPLECGEAVFNKFVLPTLKALNDKDDISKQQFYAGLMASVLGSMVADFGHEKAIAIADVLTRSVDDMKDEMHGTSIQ